MTISCFQKWAGCLTGILLMMFLLSDRGFSQEIEANVTVDRSQISGTSLNYLDNLPQELETYINEYNWTDANFREEEQIGIDMQITLLSVNNYNFEAQVVIRSRRPIYNTIQETALFFFNDENWMFNYTPNRGLIHDELQFDALTSVIDFYAYVILGYDFDSFEELGGSPYFQEAQNIVSLAQTASSSGWSRTSSNRRNRARLIADLTNNSYRGLREAIYQYHRQGLDRFVDNPEEGRQQVLQALEKIQEAKRTTSSDLLFDTFFNAKYREIVSIFEDAEPQVRLDVYNLLSNIDQSHLTEYQKLQ
jgi:hypothetical protein